MISTPTGSSSGRVLDVGCATIAKHIVGSGADERPFSVNRGSFGELCMLRATGPPHGGPAAWRPRRMAAPPSCFLYLSAETREGRTFPPSSPPLPVAGQRHATRVERRCPLVWLDPGQSDGATPPGQADWRGQNPCIEYRNPVSFAHSRRLISGRFLVSPPVASRPGIPPGVVQVARTG